MAMDFSPRLSNTPSLTQVFTPVNVAILTSLGIHGFILGLALPHWQWQEPSGENLEDRSTVGVIELTPAEQSRLPETDIFSSSSLFPSLPTGNEAIVPTDPNLPAPPDSNYNYSLPPGQTIPPPPAMPNLPAYPSLPPLTSYGNLSRLPITNPPIPSLPQLSSSRPIPRSSRTLPSPPPGQWENFTAPGLNRPNFGTLPPSQGTGFITKAPQSTNPAPEPGLTSEGEDTSPEKLRENTLVSIAQQGQAIKEKDTITGTYPPIACRSRTEAMVVYNVFPSGQKDLVGRSRYPIFNQLAQQAIAGRSYGQPTQVSVNFKYDPNICGGTEQFTPPNNQGNSEMENSPVSPSTSPSAPTNQTTPAPAGVVPTPGISPPPEPLQSRPTESPANQQPKPKPTPEVKPTPVPDAPSPRIEPPATVAPKTAPVSPPSATPRATTSPPTPSSPPAPAPAPQQRSLPKTKGDLLLEQNQAPSIVPPKPDTEKSEDIEVQSSSPSMENGLPGPIQSKK